MATSASGSNSHAEGAYTVANHKSQHVFGEYNTADGSAAEATERGNYIEIVGNGTSDALRSNARTLDWDGNEEIAGGLTIGESLSRGRKAGTTVGQWSIAFGWDNEASGLRSCAVGVSTKASGSASHTEGSSTTASGTAGHAEGQYSTASGASSHAEGYQTEASGDHSHAEGYHSVASGMYAHAEGLYTTANGRAQHVFGQYNTPDANQAEIVGNGNSSATSNARTLDWNGNEVLAGS